MNEVGRIADLIYNDLVARGKAEHTARQWKIWMLRFEQACGEKDTYTREDVVKFIGEERKRGYCQNTINTNLRPVALLAKIQGWDYPKLSMKKVKDSDVSRPIFETEDVLKLIKVGREVLNSRELALLALSTTYGLRREEMCNTSEPVITDGHITISAVKGSMKTTHLIPEEIADYIKDFRADSTSYATMAFASIIKKTGIKVDKGFGWHSIRRSLATELMMVEISGLNVLRFMRWSEGVLTGDLGMLRLYAKKEQGRIDTEVFRVHPFLGAWSDNEREAVPVSETNMTAVSLNDEEVRVLTGLVKRLNL